jgi:hypothetical protein
VKKFYHETFLRINRQFFLSKLFPAHYNYRRDIFLNEKKGIDSADRKMTDPRIMVIGDINIDAVVNIRGYPPMSNKAQVDRADFRLGLDMS